MHSWTNPNSTRCWRGPASRRPSHKFWSNRYGRLFPLSRRDDAVDNGFPVKVVGSGELRGIRRVTKWWRRGAFARRHAGHQQDPHARNATLPASSDGATSADHWDRHRFAFAPVLRASGSSRDDRRKATRRVRRLRSNRRIKGAAIRA